MADDTGKFGYKAIAAIAAVLGALVARKSLALVWKAVTGKAPPDNPEHPTVAWSEAASWAIVSGAVVGLARLAAQKKVAASWQRSTGAPPPTGD